MVYGIIKQHSGYISVVSEPEVGTTFRVYLPLAEQAAKKESPRFETEIIKGNNETILIAEDDATLRNLYSSMLRDNGYRAIEAFNGADAVLKFTNHRDDTSLIIMDGIMPKKNGKQAYDEILAIKPTIKTIFLSGYAEDIMTKEGLLVPEIIFVQKPVSPADLLKKIKEMLSSSNM